MRCAECDERFEPREETIMHEKDDVLRRFHPDCFLEFDDENPGGEARWSGGPPYEDLVMLGLEDLKNVVSNNRFNLDRMVELEEEGRDREKVKKFLNSQIEKRDERLGQVKQLEE
ncbi:MAG: hypothetical protein SVV03_05290 [Candidatus Nanohaloarchaea archaeon]|nr:hypothetical protein [Candidatus Nanohaloarchaea archaeon]